MNLHNITESTYFNKENAMKYVSCSQIKAFQKCEAAALAELKGEYKSKVTDALIVGTLIDLLLTGNEGEFEKYLEEHPELVSSRGATKGQLKQVYQKAIDCAERVKKDELMMKTLSGEKQVILVGYLFGVPCKIKVDSLTDKAIVDLKSTSDMSKSVYNEETGHYETWISAYKYPLQMAIYRHIVEQNGYGKLPCYLTVVDKTEVPDIGVFQIDSETMDEELAKIELVVKNIDAIKKGDIEPTRCEKCNYCKATKKAKILDWREVLGEID